jgi:PKD repeat protein
VDLNSINYVRIVDIPGSGDFKDSQGNPIYDGWVTFGSGGLDLEAVGVINVGAVSAPVADFTSDVTSGTAPLTVQFNDASTGVILDYAWDFNNDGTVDSTLQNPEFTYEAAGTYTVSLTVSNPDESSTETRTDYIVAVMPDSPVADFSVDVTSGSVPLTVQFTDLTTNKPVSWAWDFESDGTIDSYEQNPSWTYNAAGNYTVTLTATNLVASDTVTRVNLTSVVNLPPMADFSADPVVTLIGRSVQFTDLSANSPTSWQWDFNNDGIIDSTMQNPSYTYTTAGTYTVNLTVSNPAGSGDEVKADYITVKEQASPASNFTYTSDGSSITITEYTGSDGIVIIPAEIEGLPVITIGASAFADCSGLTTVSIPDSVTTIGDSAFSDCSGLTTLSIPNNVTSIGYYAFQGCSGLTTLNIPNNVTSIGNYMFQGCSGLTTVSIPENVTSIGTRAFEDCSGLTTLSLPNSVTSIGNGAFADCFGLTTLSIGSGVTYIGGSAFSGCSALTAINADTNNSLYTSVYGVLYDKDITTLIQCPFGKTGSVTIPDSVIRIDDFAFSDCINLTSLTIPDSVTSIGTNAFRDCTNLTSVTIGNSVTSIGNFAFMGCSSLTTVTIPDSVASIGIYAFRDCTNLTSANIGSGVRGIGTNAFSGCSALTAINVDANNSLYASVGGILYDKDITTLIQCPSGKTGSVTIPDSVTSIDDFAFSDCTALTSLTIPDSVTSIGTSAFRDCTNLISLTIPDSVTSIGTSAFRDCTNLTSLTISASVTSIGNSEFRGCTNLTSLTIPDSVTSIGTSAFRDCTNMTSLTFEGSAPTVGGSWADGSTNLVAYYQPGAAGFTTPTWQGVPCYPILPTLSFIPGDAEVIEGQTTEIVITVSSLPEGLAGYNFTVDIDDPTVAEIVGIEYPAWVTHTENSSLPGTSVCLKALDGDEAVQAEATDVVLATLTVMGKEKGNVSFTLGIDRLDDDTGTAIEATPETGTLEVTSTPIPGQENSPRDLDGDGLYEDLTGDGSFTFTDVEVFFHQIDWIEDKLPIANFDFNGNGRIDFDDIVNLFQMV